MPTNRRLQRINRTLMKEISEIIARELKDPRVTSMVSVLDASMSADMKHVDVTVSIYGPNEVENARTLAALNSAAGFISSIASKSLRLRWAPEIAFTRSHAIETGVDMYFKLKDLNKDVRDFEETDQSGS